MKAQVPETPAARLAVSQHAWIFEKGSRVTGLGTH